MNRKRGIILVAIIEFILFIPLVLLMGLGKIKLLTGIIALCAISFITLAALFFIIRKYPPMDDE